MYFFAPYTRYFCLLQKKMQKLQEAVQLKQPIFNLEWLSAKVKEL